MSAFQLLVAMVILAFPSGAWGEDAERGSIPPGVAGTVQRQA
jgi:hypothetical protein